MAITTTNVTCPAGVWTEVAAGVTTITLQPNPRQGIQVAAGSSAPSAGVVGVSPGDIGGLYQQTFATSTNVYVMPTGGVGVSCSLISG